MTTGAPFWSSSSTRNCRADATLRGKSNGQGEAGLAAPTKPKGRFDLAASLADTDAQIAALLKPSLPLAGT